MNQVERWFGLLTDKLIRRGVHTSVQALENDIRDWIATWNDNPRPFTWTKTADEILNSLADYLAKLGTGQPRNSKTNQWNFRRRTLAQRNRNARLALSVQVSRALRELGYCSLGATELPDTVSDKINWAFAGRDWGLIMYRNPALRRGFPEHRLRPGFRTLLEAGSGLQPLELDLVRY